MIALVGSSGCSLHKKSGKAAASGFAGLIVVDDKKWRKDPRARTKHLALPVVVITPAVAKQIQQSTQGAPSLPIALSLKALGKDSSGFWKGPTTLYQEGMKLLSGARKLRDEGAQLNDANDMRKMFDQAILRFRLSVKLEPRAHVASHELSNALFELSLLMDDELGRAKLEEAKEIAARLVNVSDSHQPSYHSKCSEPPGGSSANCDLETVSVPGPGAEVRTSRRQRG
jgi:hypothetical protein